MAWTQVYDPAGSVVLSALSAAIPLMVLFYMLAIRRAKGHVAAIVGLAVAFVLAVALWGMPFGTAVSSVAYGMANGLFPIVWIVITAVWVYNMTVESGEFEIIKDSLARLTDDRRLQALFIAFAFGAFLEGTAGFGTPVAITAAMLAGIGFNPLYAAGLCLIANTAPVAFGAIGVPVIVAGQVSGFDPNLISAIVGRQLPFLSVIVPLWLCVTCLLYTSDAADDMQCVDLGGRRIIKKNFFKQKTAYEISECLVGSEMCIRDSLRGHRPGLQGVQRLL